MDKEFIELEECPNCRGNGMILHEGGWCVYVECADCGAHTVYTEYSNDQEEKEATSAVVRLWNMGKVIRQERGE